MTPYSAPGILPVNTELQNPLGDLLNICCIVFGQSKDDVTSKSRKPEYVNVRIAFCYLAYELEKEPSPSIIAKHFGRDPCQRNPSQKIRN